MDNAPAGSVIIPSFWYKSIISQHNNPISTSTIFRTCLSHILNGITPGLLTVEPSTKLSFTGYSIILLFSIDSFIEGQLDALTPIISVLISFIYPSSIFNVFNVLKSLPRLL